MLVQASDEPLQELRLIATKTFSRRQSVEVNHAILILLGCSADIAAQ